MSDGRITPSPPNKSSTAVARKNAGDTCPIQGIFAASAATGVASFQIPVPTKVSASKPCVAQSARSSALFAWWFFDGESSSLGDIDSSDPREKEAL